MIQIDGDASVGALERTGKLLKYDCYRSLLDRRMERVLAGMGREEPYGQKLLVLGTGERFLITEMENQPKMGHNHF